MIIERQLFDRDTLERKGRELMAQIIAAFADAQPSPLRIMFLEEEWALVLPLLKTRVDFQEFDGGEKAVIVGVTYQMKGRLNRVPLYVRSN